MAKMQPSITMFFKSKQTATSAQEPEQQQNAGEKETSPSKVSEEKLKPNDNTEPNEKNSEKSLKRPMEEMLDKDEEVSQKRQAIASPLSTPVKLEAKSKQLNENEKPSTPSAKKVLSQENKTASPLINISLVIKKKVSSGAYALHENMGASWFRALQGEFDKPYFKKLSSFIQQERQSKTIFPPEDKVYTWTHFHDIKETRVLILGQDPYFNARQAHGLSFSVQAGVKVPPSLNNIYKELEADIPGFRPPMNGSYICGDLTGWAKQGVLMLNTCLTVAQGQAFSHQNKGWETFTDAVIKWISKNINHKMVFLLWGKPAQKKASLIDKKHKILTAAHPSPLSAHNGFFGCGHFSKTNAFLREQNLPEIDWKAL